MRLAPIDNVHRTHTTLGRIQCRINFGQHATIQSAIGFERVGARAVNLGDEFTLFVQNTFDIGEQHQLMCTHRAGNLARRHVCIDIVGYARIIGGNRRDHWDEFGLNQSIQHRRVHAHHITDQTDVVLYRCVLRIGQKQFFHAYHAPIFTTHTDRTHTKTFTRLINQIDNLPLHIATEHTIDNRHGVGIGHAHPLNELTFDTDALEHRINLRPTAMHHQHVHAHRRQ